MTLYLRELLDVKMYSCRNRHNNQSFSIFLQFVRPPRSSFLAANRTTLFLYALVADSKRVPGEGHATSWGSKNGTDELNQFGSSSLWLVIRYNAHQESIIVKLRVYILPSARLPRFQWLRPLTTNKKLISSNAICLASSRLSGKTIKTGEKRHARKMYHER